MKNGENAQIVYVGYEMDFELILDEVMKSESVERPFFVVGSVFQHLNIEDNIRLKYPHAIFFKEFLPNPTYESVIIGRNLFRQSMCDFIIAIGGGSAIDVAKCVKAYAFVENDDYCLNQTINKNNLEILAIPTTAGTGSESTHFAVIYYQGNKKSVCHTSLLPKYIILNGKFIESLPLYQRKSTMLDALCHSIESLWSINSTEESKKYATEAIELFMNYHLSYLKNENVGNLKMLCAANYAGKAINITKTTAAHAMSYKMTSLFGISHGHSVALCLPKVWYYMLHHMDQCIDKRGQKYLNSVFQYISKLLKCDNPTRAIDYLDFFIRKKLELNITNNIKNEEIAQLIYSVNTERLANNPVLLDEASLSEIYSDILNGGNINESRKTF